MTTMIREEGRTEARIYSSRNIAANFPLIKTAIFIITFTLILVWRLKMLAVSLRVSV